MAICYAIVRRCFFDNKETATPYNKTQKKNIDLKIDSSVPFKTQQITTPVETQQITAPAQMTEEMIAVIPQVNTLKAHFPNKEEAKTILSQEDRFLKALSPFDKQVRMKSSHPVSHEDFLTYYSAQFQPCESHQQEILKEYLEELSQKLNAFGIALPENIQFIQTTCHEEIPGTWAYCRGNTIYFSNLGKHLLSHELFHIYSSHNPEMRKKLYHLIGYQICPPIQLPSSLKNKRIVNPDAPDLDAYITIKYQGKDVQAVPIDLYDLNYTGKGRSTFLSGIYHKFAVVESQGNQEMRFKLDEKGEPILIDFEDAENLIEQIGKNTGYVDSPEEILADNFAIMLSGSQAQTPELIEKMKQCFTA